MIYLPEAFRKRMQTLLGEEYAAFLRAYENAPQKGLRVNTRKISADAFLHSCAETFVLRKNPTIPDAFFFDEAENTDIPPSVGNTAAHHAGLFYMQEPAAMLPIVCGNVQKGEYVLDVCAAPGGKTSQLAAAVGDSGVVVANEFVSSRAKILLSNIERLGIPNTILTNTDAAHLADAYEGCFDTVLVDAPCSGEGMFRKNPLAIDEWSEENVKLCAERSFGILCNAEKCLRPGGKLIYATCTFAPEENEYLIARFLEAHSGYTLLPIPDAVRTVTTRGIDGYGVRCYPHITGGEGQYVCVLQKDGEENRRPIPDALMPPDKKVMPAVKKLLTELFDGEPPFSVKQYGGVLYAVPPHMTVSGKVFTIGVRLGELHGEDAGSLRLVPHHQLFSAYGGQMKRKFAFPASDESLYRYQTGDIVTLSGEASAVGDGFGCIGIAAASADGGKTYFCPLGGVKKVGSTLKNHYPKGLRLK